MKKECDEVSVTQETGVSTNVRTMAAVIFAVASMTAGWVALSMKADASEAVNAAQDARLVEIGAKMDQRIGALQLKIDEKIAEINDKLLQQREVLFEIKYSLNRIQEDQAKRKGN